MSCANKQDSSIIREFSSAGFSSDKENKHPIIVGVVSLSRGEAKKSAVVYRTIDLLNNTKITMHLPT